jgi:hypothetical protein
MVSYIKFLPQVLPLGHQSWLTWPGTAGEIGTDLTQFGQVEVLSVANLVEQPVVAAEHKDYKIFRYRALHILESSPLHMWVSVEACHVEVGGCQSQICHAMPRQRCEYQGM